MDRRQFLTATALAGTAGGAVVLDPISFASADPGTGASPEPGTVQTQTITGHIEYGAPDFVYIPVQVPVGANRISVEYSYNRPAAPPGQNGNALDIGVFDNSGIELGNAAGFRGWSGGFRTSFTISAS